MKITLRKVGNSVGVIIPKAILERWGVAEGDQLVVTEAGITPPAVGVSAHEALDELKRKRAAAVASHCSAKQIRAHGLANLHRWKSTGVWVSAYDEWKKILESGDDGRLFAAMLGRDEESVRLRQSSPFAGLLPRDQSRKLNEEATR